MPVLNFLIFSIVFCHSAPGVNEFNNRNFLKGITSRKIEIEEKIDTGKTYEVFFTISEKEECIKINVNAVYMDETTQNEASAKTFFIVEKALDISRFGDSKKKVLFAELGRNFDFSWNRERDVLICSSDSDPIKKLKKDIYRIRFTAFRDQDFNYEVNVFSKKKLLVEENYPVIK
jgi:hypothetical protein